MRDDKNLVLLVFIGIITLLMGSFGIWAVQDLNESHAGDTTQNQAGIACGLFLGLDQAIAIDDLSQTVSAHVGVTMTPTVNGETAELIRTIRVRLFEKCRTFALVEQILTELSPTVSSLRDRPGG